MVVVNSIETLMIDRFELSIISSRIHSYSQCYSRLNCAKIMSTSKEAIYPNVVTIENQKDKNEVDF
jgi:hypothetical protein